MKRSLIVLLFIATAITALAFNNGTVKGWFLAGSYPAGYDIGVEKNTERNGNVAYLKSIKPKLNGKFGTIMQSFLADDYWGKRVKLTGYIKSSEVKDWVGMWCRVDGGKKETYKTLAFDNMQDRPIKGTTDWTQYEIVLDVPPSAQSISFGVLLSGTGTVWLDDLSFQVVSSNVPQTKAAATKPQNTNFEDQQN